MSIFIENNTQSRSFRNTSFIGRLEGDRIADLDEYLHLEDELYLLYESGEIPKEIRIRFGIITSVFTNFVMRHQNGDVNDRINNLSTEKLISLLQRMSLVVEGLGKSELQERSSLPNISDS